MKDSVQIKAELFEGRHDALLGFYERYSRLFVNKLLLKLCEGIMPSYKPSLALFDQQPDGGNAKGRKVSILIDKESSPLMFAFYCGLPYGSRTMVIVNLMNSYVQVAEADPKLMERLYWDSFVPAPRVVDTETAPAFPSASEPHDPETPALPRSGSGEAVGGQPMSPVGAKAHENKDQDTPVPQSDPLSELDTGL
ncbi:MULTISPECIES: hypothetical protein [Pseudomonas]|uniref:hypothetical protein n=1 Tax=Pseudomonas TaxID=286 RepID=UPI00070F5DE4|nr:MULTISPECIES: hypothetical protein [Pseudomonas]KQW19824.1 hypothetical protein ASC85_08220 [Pseudomonas sp. Root401]PWD02012.1 hypothetical protein CX658_18835 [Pseudomonas amygdali pv. lachrymans]WHS57408.1 hypothetical protein QLH64_30795 [Pseudomonas brassicacearum]WNZ87511.1 hypothetical protein QOM10_29955 [Pseudomonas sp. P108]